MTAGDPAEAQAVVRDQYGAGVLQALIHIDEFLARGAGLVARGRKWYDGDPDGVPHLACGAVIIKLGEAVTRIPQELRNQHSRIPWTVMSDIRNHLTHAYDITDYAIVWDTIENDFLAVHGQLRRILGYGHD
jgi:hypothetical protein